MNSLVYIDFFSCMEFFVSMVYLHSMDSFLYMDFLSCMECFVYMDYLPYKLAQKGDNQISQAISYIGDMNSMQTCPNKESMCNSLLCTWITCRTRTFLWGQFLQYSQCISFQNFYIYICIYISTVSFKFFWNYFFIIYFLLKSCQNTLLYPLAYLISMVSHFMKVRKPVYYHFIIKIAKHNHPLHA
jgi:hypothetical protein